MPMRLSGLASGLDTETMVRDIVNAEKMKVAKFEKERTSYQWKQDAIRDIVKKTHDFQNKYFDLLKPDTNIRSGRFFSAFNHNVTASGVASTAISVQTRASAIKTEYTIDRISQLATKDVWNGSKSGISVLQSGTVDLNAIKNPQVSADLTADLKFTVAIGKVSKKITLTSADTAMMNTEDDLAATLNSKIKEAFGAQYNSVVSAQNGKLQMEFAGSEVRLFRHGKDTRLLHAIGVENGASSYAYKNKSVGELFGFTDADLANFEINGVGIELKSGMKLSDVVKTINKSGAGVELYFDSLADKMVMKSSKTGSANDINIEQGSTADRVLGVFLGSTAYPPSVFNPDGTVSNDITREAGQNAVLSIDGTEIIKDSNTFTINGMTFTAHEVYTDVTKPIKVSAEPDTDKLMERVKAFVDDYNELIDGIQEKLSEPVYKKYQPLTEEEKVMLSEEEVKKIEDKAKSGILKNDRELRMMMDKIRAVMVDTLEGKEGLSLRKIGIRSESWRDKGHLSIDDIKLKKAIKNDLKDVVDLFTRTSKESYVTGDRNQRYKENGLAERLNDVIKDFTRITRDKNGKKGKLVERAGLEHDASVAMNRMTKELRGKDRRIMSMYKRLQAKEEYYYRMFAQMEAAMNQLQGQQNNMMSMLGGGR